MELSFWTSRFNLTGQALDGPFTLTQRTTVVLLDPEIEIDLESFQEFFFSRFTITTCNSDGNCDYIRPKLKMKIR